MPSTIDFSLSSKSANMKRKQSSPLTSAQSLLAALGKPGQRGYNAPPSSYAAPAASYTPSIASSDESHETSNFYPDSSTRGARSVSNSTTTTAASIYGRAASVGAPVAIRRPDDVYRLVRERLAAWSYLMQWYNGDSPWLNTVHVSRTALEATLGPKVLDMRARQEYALGLSLAALFDITGATDYLRAVSKLLDEWEQWAETAASKGVVVGPIRNFFRPQRAKPRPSVATNTATAEVTLAPVDAQSESFLVLAVMPFTPDYFQVHASTCSIIRDVYKKVLGMLLPPSRGQRPADPGAGTLLHPSTLILGTALDGSQVEVASDAAIVGGELPHDRTLTGEGQKLAPSVVDLLVKVDARLKKHYAALVRDGDVLARKVLDEEMERLTASLTGGTSLRYTVAAVEAK
ncbi:uncharacterized protein LOC62_05G006952 [Vanrija pseudolonga]|uniref:Uncharacterized protein n=1 Tax=Vanrija pseudolonga TaxID=143232 RepID=A0AAF1BK19_9TREE|nr:hypothetical protein LOC62_05G006952 [Vanrija pseudolonga]